jgi:long-chain acyl-CoA synthetase
MQFAIHAAAPCPIETKEQMIEWWGPVIVEYYAASEAAGATMIDSAAVAGTQGLRGTRGDGPDPHRRRRGQRAAAGRDRHGLLQRPQVTFEYHNEPEKTAESYNERGWATTGDVGYVDEEGYLYLTDRKHFTIISGGVNIYPQEVENLLITHDKVADVAVFGVP